MPRVLITDNLSPAGLNSLKDAGLEVDVKSGLKPLEVRDALKDADGIIIRSGTTLTEELLKDQPRLKVIVRAGVGVDNIDLAAATREGIVVMKTLAVVGLGRIGLAVAKRAVGLEMKVIGYDPFLSAERAAEHGIEVVRQVDDLIERCDFLTVHTPLTEETKGLINAPRLSRMRKGVRIINCARGGIVDEVALADAIESGHVAGAALDVFEKEPPG